MKRALLFAFGLLVIAAVIAAVILLTSAKRAKPVVVVEEPPSARVQTFDAMKMEGNAVYVENQTAGASVVSVGFAIMQVPGYVEIRANEDGHPGTTVGTSRPLPTGGGEHFLVSLDAPLEEHAVYYALLVDEGKTPLTDAEGNIALMSFTALPGAEPETGTVEP